MTFKDFWTGQVVYEQETQRRRHARRELREVVVRKIGRKYIHVSEKGFEESIYWRRFFHKNPSDPYLTMEGSTFSDEIILIPGEKGLNDYNETINLRGWLKKATQHCMIEKYSLGQLKAVKEILAGPLDC